MELCITPPGQGSRVELRLTHALARCTGDLRLVRSGLDRRIGSLARTHSLLFQRDTDIRRVGPRDLRMTRASSPTGSAQKASRAA